MNIISSRFSVLFFLLLLFAGCKNYSFTGASVGPDVKTVSIAYFQNLAPLVQPTLSQTLTEKLKDKFIKQTTLTLVKSDGDLNFEGSIMDYSIRPSAISSGDNTALSRLTIGINVKFVNRKDEKMNFETRMEWFSDFPSSKSLQEEEDRLIREITDHLVEDIFTRSVVNW